MFCKEFSTKFVLAPRMIGLAIYYIVLNQISSPFLNSFFFSDSNGKSGKCTFLTREESGTQCGKTRILLSFEKYFVKPIFSETHGMTASNQLISRNLRKKTCEQIFVVSTLWDTIFVLYLSVVRPSRSFDYPKWLLLNGKIEQRPKKVKNESLSLCENDRLLSKELQPFEIIQNIRFTGRMTFRI